MGLITKIRNSLASLVAAIAISSCSSSCAGVQTRPDNETTLGAAIMISGKDSRSSMTDAFQYSNNLLTEHFQRTFSIHEFNAGERNEPRLHNIIKNLALENTQIIISYAGHGGLAKKVLADGRELDALYFPDNPPSQFVVPTPRDTRRSSLRTRNVRFINNTWPSRTLSEEQEQDLARRLEQLDMPNTPLNREYVQFYNPNDHVIYPQEILLLLKNYNGRLAFITNSCYAGQVNELLKRDTDLHALAFASSSYDEMSIAEYNDMPFGARGFYLSRALAARFGNSLHPIINLANERPDLAKFIIFARWISGKRIDIRHSLRDDGFNFQRYSNIHEFYF
jgi:hypothetical protein